MIENKSQLQNALPKHLTADRLIRIAITALSKTPALLECTKTSLLGSILLAGQLGLNPDGILGEGYLIPFNNRKRNVKECQFLIGYRGYVKLAMQSGMVSSFQARCVYEGDMFNYAFGLDEKLEHIPAKENRGALTYVYAIVKMKDGGYMFEVMNKNEVELIRQMSKNANGDTWKNFYDEMAKKTVIRKLAKIAPLSEEFRTAAGMDEQVEVLDESQKNDVHLLGINIGDEIQSEVENNINNDSNDLKTDEEKEKIEEVKKKGTDAIANALKNAKQYKH
ncbi:MAG: recombination and repair protein RecT [Chlorobi bacterium OLB5]|nr:MAG: recombination and repair protein RecT [Chlorobi bacterium OLB5]